MALVFENPKILGRKLLTLTRLHENPKFRGAKTSNPHSDSRRTHHLRPETFDPHANSRKRQHLPARSSKMATNLAKQRIHLLAREANVCAAVRAWQKNSVAKRCSLSALSARLGVTTDYLKSVTKKGQGPRKRARNRLAKKELLCTALRTYRGAKKLCTTPVRSEEVRVRSGQRLVSGLRAAHRQRVKKLSAAWRKKHPNIELSQDQYADMVRCSPWSR